MNKPINKTSTVKAVDGSEKNLRTINELKDLKKFQDGTFKEPTPGTTLHRKKHPELYGYKYTSALERAAYPKAGTAPSEKGLIKWALEESPEPIVKNPVMKKAISEPRAITQPKAVKVAGIKDSSIYKTLKDPRVIGLDLGHDTIMEVINLIQNSGLVKKPKPEPTIPIEEKIRRFAQAKQNDTDQIGVASLLGIPKRFSR